MPYNSLFDIISVVCEAEEEWWFPSPNIFFCIPASAALTATVNSKGIKTLLADGLATFFY